MRRATRLVRHPALRGVLPGLACAVAAALIARTGDARGLDDWLFDGCFALRDIIRGPRPSSAPVVLITLADEDLDAFEKPLVFISPELGDVVIHARAQGAKTVGLDVRIPGSLSGTIRVVKDPLGPAAALGKAVRKADRVVLPVVVPGGDEPIRWPVEQWLLKYRDPDRRDPQDRDIGAIDLVEDGDRFVRRATLLKSGPNNELIPSFPLALAAWAEDKSYTWDKEARTLRLGGDVIPLDAEQKMRINYVGPPGSFKRISFQTVLKAAHAGEAVPELNGAIVIIGATSKDIQDYRPTPYANRYADYRPAGSDQLMPGVEIHGHVVATIYDRAFITRPWWLHPWPWLALVGAGLGWLTARLGLFKGFLLVAVHHVAWKLLAAAALAWGYWRVDMVGMLALGLLVYATAFALRWRVLRRVLAAVKSQALAKALEEDPGRLDLAGENRIVTVMFVDLRGFSTFSAGLRDRPQQVVAVLNAYFAAVIPDVEAEGGTVNQFMGDGMMVLFNAPLEHPDDHALRAVLAARAVVRTVRSRAAEWAKLGYPGLGVGVGINTGTCTVGAVGGPTRLDYTAIGDATNAAARLESATRAAGVDILIGPETHRLIPPDRRAALGCDAESQTVELKGVGTMNVYAVRSD